MSSPGDRVPDLGLERLGERGGPRPAPLGEAALVSQALGPVQSQRDLQAAYEALVDAVFTAAGAVEWLAGLRRTVAAMLAGEKKGARHPVPHDAIREAGPGLGGARRSAS